MHSQKASAKVLFDFLDMLIEQVESLRQNLLTVIKKVCNLRLKEEYAEKYDALTSIPGHGLYIVIEVCLIGPLSILINCSGP